MHLRSLLRPALLVPLLLAGEARAQSYYWDFEGTNGLNGWKQSTAQPLQTAAGFGSATSVKLTTGPLGSPQEKILLCHPIAYNPTARYILNYWQRATSSEATLHLYMGWVDTMSFVTDWNANSYTNTNTQWHWHELGGYTAPTGGVINAAFCFVVEVSSATVMDTWIDDISVEIVPATEALMQLRVLLGGPHVNGTTNMNHALVDAGLVPTTEPYSAMGYPQVIGGGETIPPGPLLPDILVPWLDWVRIELRSANNPSLILATKQVMLQAGGGVAMGRIGGWVIRTGLPNGSYYVAVRHRNHLGCMTAAPVVLNAGTIPTVDFRSAQQATWGSEARRSDNAAHLMLWPGNCTADASIKYTGSGNDRDALLTAVGGNTPNNTITGQYRREDVNLDGVVKYTGVFNDRDVILTTVGSTTPNAVKVQQLP